MKKGLFLGAVFGLMCAVASPASSQNICGPHEEIVKRLESGYQEKRAGVGLAGNGTLVELFISKDKGTWTFMYTRPDGVTCLMAAGGDWERIEDPVAVTEEFDS
ncbi:hypothetical protein [Aestuariispira insulae]|uniref:YpeB-like protein with protease inhibitory function n=1 Tax=Aestuariispira insulae TaxID=1461337 RepID=A0A3D9HWY3_9PROT|nr:hypothetical protein [Aestuariispira insulae]RED54008.1 hypothetical protein DFP90_101809 [Aestuariispira insulae]